MKRCVRSFTFHPLLVASTVSSPVSCFVFSRSMINRIFSRYRLLLQSSNARQCRTFDDFSKKIINPKLIVWFNDRFTVNRNKINFYSKTFSMAFTVVRKKLKENTLYMPICVIANTLAKKCTQRIRFFYCFGLFVVFKHWIRALSHKWSFTSKYTIETKLKFASHTMFRRAQINSALAVCLYIYMVYTLLHVYTVHTDYIAKQTRAQQNGITRLTA